MIIYDVIQTWLSLRNVFPAATGSVKSILKSAVTKSLYKKTMGIVAMSREKESILIFSSLGIFVTEENC